MQVIHSPLHRLHDGGKELHRGALVPLFESPARVEYIVRAAERAGFALVAPDPLPTDAFDGGALSRVHDPRFVAFLRGAWSRWQADGREGFMLPSAFPARSMRSDRLPQSIDGQMGWYAIDSGTPIVAGTWTAVEAAAHCALTAAARVAAGARAAYALCRPPGHHAGRATYGGYCFLNNAALSAQALRDAGCARVAVLDVDYHHGNGTQDIFYARDDVLTVSIHGTPETEYPWFLGYADERGTDDGEGCNLNLPLPRGTGWDVYDAALGTALEAIARFAPAALVVSLGVDTYAGDPISAFALEQAHFPLLGKRIGALGLPTVLVQEGGYAVEEIGTNVIGVLTGFLTP